MITKLWCAPWLLVVIVLFKTIKNYIFRNYRKELRFLYRYVQNFPFEKRGKLFLRCPRRRLCVLRELRLSGSSMEILTPVSFTESLVCVNRRMSSMTHMRDCRVCQIWTNFENLLMNFITKYLPPNKMLDGRCWPHFGRIWPSDWNRVIFLWRRKTKLLYGKCVLIEP